MISEMIICYGRAADSINHSCVVVLEIIGHLMTSGVGARGSIMYEKSIWKSMDPNT